MTSSHPRRDASALDFDAVTPAVRSSRLGRFTSALWLRLHAAGQDSRVARGATAIYAGFEGMEVAARIAFIGCLLGAAMAVHILLILFAERYPFPSRAALIVPGIVLLLALISIVMRHTLAAAWQDRRRAR